MTKSVVFCCSQRFKPELEQFIKGLQICSNACLVHIRVLEPEFEDRPPAFLNASEAERLKDEVYKARVGDKVFEHLFKKVLPADVCFIFNLNGYIGANTIGELFAAAALRKICYALDPRMLMGKYPDQLYEEPSAIKLIHEVVPDPVELCRRLM
ncbi:MAG: hypothetical protein UY12_C0035G0009 [Parcubacteria group bacterium GW2011_GWA2_47_8b]|uniref:MazG nucleotide pyrophosphohydrolase n=2 Tax=Parcubacteria group TaxID=1794811 RepID=A0A0G1T5W5_9BACT|nr:MAG: hypothetical protein UY02_C0006G0004 [Candidatus Giovannonibacteria bacterium GW2011_GWB1_47_6b]KKU83498.1 MAG: hypothetical protein UY12_C0035G0009 [Parcubacteria group bacterium GW2011_GWA2_47_8b]KKU92691.1 MAG: hypothetical protein UY24_C0031G0002 [Parcubacteria group bacterium GW2011_GWA1_48_11b]OGY65032.1 MAG: hypothetical protein A3E64_00720 [Candidatus Harrisonbacteria bacterium RIFCSPHIGHO2_12_FULL_48_16]